MSEKKKSDNTKTARSPKKRSNKKPVSKRPSAKKAESAQVETSAGGIVYKRTPEGVRIAFILDPFGKWAFAKGHVEKGESIEEAAIRETREEMGLGNLRVVRPLGNIDFWFRDRYRPETRGTLVHKYVHYFLMEAPSDAKGKPQKKEKIRRVIWVPLGKMLYRSSYDDVKEILHKVKRHFRPKDVAQTRRNGTNAARNKVTRAPQKGRKPDLKSGGKA